MRDQGPWKTWGKLYLMCTWVVEGTGVEELSAIAQSDEQTST